MLYYTNVASITYHKGIASLTERHGTTGGGLPVASDDLCSDADLQVVDPYMGFSRDLVALLYRVMGLRHGEHDSGREQVEFTFEIMSM